MNVYPIFLNNLTGRRCIVVGNGHDAERKVCELLACEAAVTLISPVLAEGLQALADAGEVSWHARAYRRGDLKEAFLVIVTETNPEATAPIFEEAEAEKVLINAMDDVQHCTFVAGSVVRRGNLMIAISTSGSAPALSVRIRQHLEQAFGPEYEAFLDLMQALREPMAATYPDFEERRRRWYALVDAHLPALLREGLLDVVFERIDALAGPSVGQAARQEVLTS